MNSSVCGKSCDLQVVHQQHEGEKYDEVYQYIKDIPIYRYILVNKLAFPHTTYRLRSFLSLGIVDAESLHKFKKQLGFPSINLSIEGN